MADEPTTTSELAPVGLAAPAPALPEPEPTAPTLVEALGYNDADSPSAPKPDAPAPTDDTKPTDDAVKPDADTKPADDVKPADDTKPDDTKPAEPIPLTAESYADLKLPEGLEVDDALFGKAKSAFADAGIDPSKAPALLDLFKEALGEQNKIVSDAMTAHAARLEADITTLRAMPEFQGERRAQTEAVLGRAMEEFGTPALRERLAVTGMTNDPDLVRMIYSMSRMLVEDGPAPSGLPRALGANGKMQADANRSLGARIYVNADGDPTYPTQQ